MSEERIQIKVSDVLAMLEQGKTREEVRDHYGLNGVELTALFKHEKLKGRRTHKKLPFVIVDDTEVSEEVSNNTEEAVEIENPPVDRDEVHDALEEEEEKEAGTTSWGYDK